MIQMAGLRRRGPPHQYFAAHDRATRDPDEPALRRADPVETVWALAGCALLIVAYGAFAPGPAAHPARVTAPSTRDLTSTPLRSVAALPEPTPGSAAHPPGARPSAGPPARP
jgi:hypothetical protein